MHRILAGELFLSLSLCLGRLDSMDAGASSTFRRPSLSRDRKFGLKIRISAVGRIKAEILSDLGANTLGVSRLSRFPEIDPLVRDFRARGRLPCGTRALDENSD